MNFKLWILQIIAILLFNFTGSIAQIFPDSLDNLIVEKSEFQHIIKVNIAKNTADSLLKIRDLQILHQTDIIALQDTTIKLQDDNIIELQNYIKIMAKPFYDSFVFGAGSMGLFALILALCLK